MENYPTIYKNPYSSKKNFKN